MAEAMRRAVEKGINFFDTADAYGNGLSEKIAGEALKVFRRENSVLATKVFHPFYDDGRRHPDLSKKYIISECEASLKRLGMDYIDLYQCHAFDPLADLEETAAAMDKLKIRRKDKGLRSKQLQRLAAPGGARIRRLPLLPAVLQPDFSGERFKSLCERVRQLKPLADKYSITTVQLVLGATIMNPMIDCAIVGIKNPEHIEEAAGAADKSIDRGDYFKVREILSME